MRCEATMSSFERWRPSATLRRISAGISVRKKRRRSSRKATSSGVKRKSMAVSSGLVGGRAEGSEAASLLGDPPQQRCGLQALLAGARGELLQPLDDPPGADLVGVEHRAAAPGRPAVAVEPDHVDVAGPGSDALVENARALVDHRVDQALDDLLPRDQPARHAEARRDAGDEPLHLRVRLAGAGALGIEVV